MSKNTAAKTMQPPMLQELNETIFIPEFEGIPKEIRHIKLRDRLLAVRKSRYYGNPIQW